MEAYVQSNIFLLSPFSTTVETVVCLGKNFSKPKEYVQIGIDAEDYYRIKDAQKEQEKK